MDVVCLKTGTGVYKVEATAVQCGQNFNICIGGGDTYHIGAVALGLPRPSLAEAERTSASASVLCVTSHKEDEIARAAALSLATVLKTRVVVTCGLHIDNALQGDIEILYENYLALLEQLEQALTKKQPIKLG